LTFNLRRGSRSNNEMETLTDLFNWLPLQGIKNPKGFNIYL
jgi:hypothetical protein